MGVRDGESHCGIFIHAHRRVRSDGFLQAAPKKKKGVAFSGNPSAFNVITHKGELALPSFHLFPLCLTSFSFLDSSITAFSFVKQIFSNGLLFIAFIYIFP